MAVPSSGELELRGDIALEVYGTATGSNISLGTMSNLAGFSDPDTMSEFYGYSSADAPSVTTNNISNIGETNVRLNGNITSDGGATITERGFYFGTNSSSPTNNPKYTVSGTTGTYSNNRTGLNSSTTYYCWAFATNSKGTTYGSRVQASTIAAFVPTFAEVGLPQTTAEHYATTYGGPITVDSLSVKYYQNPNTGSLNVIGSWVSATYSNYYQVDEGYNASDYGGSNSDFWATNAVNWFWNEMTVTNNGNQIFASLLGYPRNNVSQNFSNRSWDSSGFNSTVTDNQSGDVFQIKRESLYGDSGTFFRLRQFFNFN